MRPVTTASFQQVREGIKKNTSSVWKKYRNYLNFWELESLNDFHLQTALMVIFYLTILKSHSSECIDNHDSFLLSNLNNIFINKFIRRNFEICWSRSFPYSPRYIIMRSMARTKPTTKITAISYRNAS